MVYDLKPKGLQKTATAINHSRRVTYGIDGKPIVRLVEQRDLIGEDTLTPMQEYVRTKSQNQDYFKELDRAASIEDKMRITTKYTGNTIKLKHKSIFMDKETSSQVKSIFDSKSRPKTSQSISYSSSRVHKIEKYKLMKQMLESEKSVS
jgi:hypothetical protein